MLRCTLEAMKLGANPCHNGSCKHKKYCLRENSKLWQVNDFKNMACGQAFWITNHWTTVSVCFVDLGISACKVVFILDGCFDCQAKSKRSLLSFFIIKMKTSLLWLWYSHHPALSSTVQECWLFGRPFSIIYLLWVWFINHKQSSAYHSGGGRVGLRRRFKAPISSEARVRIPSFAFCTSHYQVLRDNRQHEVNFQHSKRFKFKSIVYKKMGHGF